MFSDPGLSALSLQLEIYRWEDHFDRMRTLNREANSLAAANAQLDWVIREYNGLAQRFNGLWNAVRDTMPKVGELEQRIQAQEQELRARDARIAELALDLERRRLEVEYLRLRETSLYEEIERLEATLEQTRK